MKNFSPTPHVTKEAVAARQDLPLFGTGRASKLRAQTNTEYWRLQHPLPNYNMWRGNHSKYKYTQSSLSHYGEGNAVNQYHQHYAHAKDPTDYGKGGREFEMMNVKRGKMVQKPLPKVQYADPKSKPTWLWKSWHGSLSNLDMWQREVQYPEHVPEHLGAKRPLAVLAPRTNHATLHAAHMDKLTITISPFMFGFGASTQQAVMQFYRRAISARSPLRNDRVFLFYSLDLITPQIEVTWVDGSTYVPPVLEGATAQDLIQMVMEQSWLAGDRMAAGGRTLQPLSIDDYKWSEMALKKVKKKLATKK